MRHPYIFLCLLALFSPRLQAGATCFVTAEKIERIKNRLKQTRGIVVTEGDRRIPKDFGGYFRHENLIGMDGSFTNLDKKVSLHHEAVHVATDRNFRNNPTAENAALAIIFARTEPLDPNLPEEYKKYFQLDEVKAYSKSSSLLSQIGTHWKANALESPRRPLELAAKSKDKARIFSTTSLHFLKKLRQAVLDAESGKHPLEASLFLYAKDTPDHFIVEVTLQQIIGTPVVISIPLHDPQAQSRGAIHQLHEKLLNVCNAGIKLLER
jgi:hypothetical protein